DRRREIQRRYNEANGITPQSVKSNIRDLSMAVYEADYVTVPVEGDGAEYQPEQIPAIVAELEKEMRRASEALEFEKAAQLRDRILGMKDLELGVRRNTTGVRGMLGSGAASGAFARGPAARRPQRRRRR
ncbi:MAG: excinuclease subunit, partial [Anaeromyxobacteraceae bacterium]|nr:excinuclease subunit [Anaeromyxobacteraceae bacterium]